MKLSLTNLAIRFPEIAVEWHPTKNSPMKAEDVLPGSNKNVWWQCSRGHEWKARINNRTQKRTRCPYCSGSLPIKGVNDLASCYPKIAAEWHPTKNGDLDPSNLLPNSNRRVSWLCAQGHEWETKVHHRTNGSGCPYCAGQRPIIGVTDLQTVNYMLSTEWHPFKNGNKTPSQFTPRSHRKVWWRCSYGHEWQATITSRTTGSGCPICSGRRVLAGFNDLATRAPLLAEEWCTENNGDLSPAQVTLHSNLYVWWRCKCGHEWRTSINNRANGTGCPYCNLSRLIPEKTSLAVINPALATQWDTEKNAPFTPKDVTAYCNKAYWWRCDYGHSWKAVIANRNLGRGCPYCNGRLPIHGENDFATTQPQLAQQWNAERNEGQLPSQYLPLSSKIVWWKCEQGHEWQAAISTRTLGSGCPYCMGRKKIFKP